MDAIQPFLGWLHEHLLSIVFVVSLIDATGVPFPGRAMLIAAGMAAQGPRDVGLLIATSVIGSVVGDHILYALGMRRGTRLLALYCRLSLGSVRCVETFFRRYGGMARPRSHRRRYGPRACGRTRSRFAAPGTGGPLCHPRLPALPPMALRSRLV